jgi:Nodulation protein Z (NodZ)
MTFILDLEPSLEDTSQSSVDRHSARTCIDRAAVDSSGRFVVARFANGGIGDHLSCLMGSWWFAKQTGRSLVIDWRGSRFNLDAGSGRNCFEDLFQARNSLAGVPTLTGDVVSRLPFTDACYPPKWNRANLRATEHVSHTADEIATVNRLVNSGHERREQWVAFNQWIDPPPPLEEARQLLRELQFVPAIQTAAAHWFSEAVGTRAAVAVHIRHGNGENIGSRAGYWLDPWRFARQWVMNQRNDMHRAGRHGRFGDNMPESLIRTKNLRGSERAFLKRVRARVRRVQDRLGGQAVPILFCDSSAVVETATQLMPDLLVPPKTFLAPNAGPLHGLESGGAVATSRPTTKTLSFEMGLEMELMRRCSALVCMSSGFSIFPQTMLEPDRIELLHPNPVNRLLEKVLRRLPLGR